MSERETYRDATHPKRSTSQLFFCVEGDRDDLGIILITIVLHDLPKLKLFVRKNFGKLFLRTKNKDKKYMIEV